MAVICGNSVLYVSNAWRIPSPPLALPTGRGADGKGFPFVDDIGGVGAGVGILST